MLLTGVKKSLRWKLIIASIAVLVFVIGLLAVNSVRLLNQASEGYGLAHQDEIRPLLNASLAPLLFQRDFAAIQDFLNDLNFDPDHGFVFVTVLDDQGQIAGERGSYEESPAVAEEVYTSAVSLELAGEFIGEVRFGYSLAYLKKAKEALLFQGAFIATLGIVLALFLLGAIGLVLTRHIAGLVDGAKVMSEGEYNVAIDIASEDEIGQLADSFNEMAVAVKERALELSASEERFKNFAESSSDWFWEMDSKLRFTYGSERFFNLTGYSHDDVYGRERRDLINQELEDIDSEKWRRHSEQLDNHQSFKNLEYKIMTKNGKVLDISISGNAVFNSNGDFIGYQGTGTDITKRKQAEEELARHRDHLHELVMERTKELEFQKLAIDEHAIVSITDVKGNITYANDKFCSISGYTHEELEGKNHRIIKSDEHSAEFYADMWKTIANGNIWQGEIKNIAKNGDHYWVMSTIVPFKDDKGKPFQYISIRTDITERKNAEIEIVAANRAKSDLMANMSHELRTPLNAIIGFADTMKSEVFGPINNNKYLEYLDDIRNSGEHLLMLINDILDVSSIEAGALILNEKNVDLSDAIDRSVRLIGPRAQAGRVLVTSSTDIEIPMLYADERRIKQVLLNLLSNAVKFTPEGGEVSVNAQLKDDGSIAVSIADTGMGMDEKEITVAMSKFGQVDSGLDRKHEGTGLGLPMTKGLIELHGGNLEIKSRKGDGTSVTATFPKQRVIENVR